MIFYLSFRVDLDCLTPTSKETFKMLTLHAGGICTLLAFWMQYESRANVYVVKIVFDTLDKRGQKQLASLTSASCVVALVDLACESGTAKTEATQTYASGYLCKKCFNSITKYSG